MGTTSQKLEYLNGTKSSLKTAINNLGGDIDNNTTFRNYATELNDIYDNLPKVSDTGTNVSLSPTLKGRLGSVLNGNTYQETTTGKNLLNLGNVSGTNSNVTYSIENGKLKLNGTCSADRITINLPTQNALNGTYTFSTNYSTYNIALKNSSYNNLFITTTSVTATINDTITQIVIYSSNGTQYNNKLIELQVESGSTATSYEPYTGGIASPNPDYPQEIQSATGTQKVVVSGKNLWNKDDENALLGYYNSNGTFASNSTYRCNKFACNVGDTFIKSGDGWGGINTFWNNDTFVSSTNENSVTIPSGVNNVRFACLYSSENAQLEKGSTSTPYQPYQEPQEVDIELSSRNKWDEEWEQGYYNANGNPVGNTENAIRSKNFIPVLPETNIYYYNGTNNGGRICFYDNNKNFISTITNSNVIRTTPANCYYIMFSTSTNYGSTYNNDICINISDEKNGTYTPYYNYSLNKIGDYEDYITGTPDNWVLYKNIGKVVLNGSESWNYSSGVFYIYINDGIITTGLTCLSDYYTSKENASNGSGAYNNGNNTCCFRTNNHQFFIRDDRYNDTTINDFKTWLSTHNTEVLYVLATETTEAITDTNLISQLNELYYLMSYNDTTNIDVTGNLPMRITASAIKGA